MSEYPQTCRECGGLSDSGPECRACFQRRLGTMNPKPVKEVTPPDLEAEARKPQRDSKLEALTIEAEYYNLLINHDLPGTISYRRAVAIGEARGKALGAKEREKQIWEAVMSTQFVIQSLGHQGISFAHLKRIIFGSEERTFESFKEETRKHPELIQAVKNLKDK